MCYLNRNILLLIVAAATLLGVTTKAVADIFRYSYASKGTFAGAYKEYECNQDQTTCTNFELVVGDNISRSTDTNPLKGANACINSNSNFYTRGGELIGTGHYNGCTNVSNIFHIDTNGANLPPISITLNGNSCSVVYGEYYCEPAPIRTVTVSATWSGSAPIRKVSRSETDSYERCKIILSYSNYGRPSLVDLEVDSVTYTLVDGEIGSGTNQYLSQCQ